MPSRLPWRPGSTPRAPPSTTSATSMERGARFRTASWFTGAPASPVRAVGRRSRRSSSAAAAPMSVSAASPSPGAGRLGGQQLIQATLSVCRQQRVKAADQLLADNDLREGDHPGAADELVATVRVLCQIDLLIVDATAGEQCLRANALRTIICRVQNHLLHNFRKYSIEIA